MGVTVETKEAVTHRLPICDSLMDLIIKSRIYIIKNSSEPNGYDIRYILQPFNEVPHCIPEPSQERASEVIVITGVCGIGGILRRAGGRNGNT